MCTYRESHLYLKPIASYGHFSTQMKHNKVIAKSIEDFLNEVAVIGTFSNDMF